MKHKKQKKTTQGTVSQKYRINLSKEQNDDYVLKRVLQEHYIFKEGHVKRSIDLIVKANKDNIKEIFWRVLLINNQSKLTGVRVLANNQVIEYNVLEENNTLQTIHIILNPLLKNQTAHLQFEYYITNVCNIIKKGVFYYELEYPFAYKPISETSSFELRLHIPGNATFNVDSNLPCPESFCFNNNQIVISKEEKFISGDVSGKLQIKGKTRLFVPLFSSILSLIFTAFIAIIQEGNKYIGNWYYFIIPLVLFLIISLSIKLIDFTKNKKYLF